MANFVLIHGAGDTGWYWHLAAAELRAKGHHVIAPDLPCDNATASLDDYVGAVAEPAAGRTDPVFVGQSYGAFTATLAASRLPARLLVLLAGIMTAPSLPPSCGGRRGSASVSPRMRFPAVIASRSATPGSSPASS
jgi:pimeloyl-ACP methyl ester carboxylesterase